MKVFANGFESGMYLRFKEYWTTLPVCTWKGSLDLTLEVPDDSLVESFDRTTAERSHMVVADCSGLTWIPLKEFASMVGGALTVLET